MEEIRKFTARDYLSGACHELEIGSPWSDRWTKTDAFYGRCTASDIGTPKQPAPEPDQQSEPFAPMTTEQRRQMSVALVDKLLKQAHDNPAAMMEDGSAQLNKLIDLARDALASADGNQQLKVDSIRAFGRLDPPEQDRALVDVLVSFVPAESLTDALERLGMTQKQFERMRIASDDLEALHARQDALQERLAELMADAARERIDDG
jgi:hypothetical protein